MGTAVWLLFYQDMQSGKPTGKEDKGVSCHVPREKKGPYIVVCIEKGAISDEFDLDPVKAVRSPACSNKKGCV